MEFTEVFAYEGPLASVLIHALQEEAFVNPVLVQSGIFADRYWKATPQEFSATIGKTYRVTIEVEP